jgi:gas vesicle protein
MPALRTSKLAEEDLMHKHTPGFASPFGLLLSFVAGSVAGAGAALLLAPHSGRATREMVRRKVRDTAGSTRWLKDQVIERDRQIKDEASQRVEDAVSVLAGSGGVKLEG